MKPIALATLFALLILATTWVLTSRKAPSDPLACLRQPDCPIDATAWTLIADSQPVVWDKALRFCVQPEHRFHKACLPIAEVTFTHQLQAAARRPLPPVPSTPSAPVAP